MLKLSDIRLTDRHGAAGLRLVAAGALGIPEGEIRELQIHRLSIDARRKADVRFVYTLLVGTDEKLAAPALNLPNVSIFVPQERYVFPETGGTVPKQPPIITGTGPAATTGTITGITGKEHTSIPIITAIDNIFLNELFIQTTSKMYFILF